MQEHANEDVEKMILGNKCDMEDKRVISKERGETIARENGVPFLEVRCSELAHHEINSLYDYLVISASPFDLYCLSLVRQWSGRLVI